MTTDNIQFSLVYFVIYISVGYALPPSRVVDGMEASKIPYLVSIQTPSGFLWCGGAIIDARHILTAAHCFINEDRKNYLEQLEIVIGTNDKNNRTSENVFKIAKVTILDDYDPQNSYKHDIAVVKLNRTIPFTSHQMPVKLPSDDTPVGTIVMTSGWGATHWSKIYGRADAFPQYLRYFYSTVINREQCQRMMPNDNIHSSHICTWAGGSGTTCKGDSGGPAIAGNVIIGIISFNEYCDPLYPDVYTRVYKYVDWIRETISND